MQIDASSSTSIPDLPPELLLLICEYLLNFSQKAALARLVRCSRETYSLVSPFLYDNITITRAIAGLIFSGLAQRPTRCRRSRRGRPSASTGIGFGELTSRSHYLEWSAIRRKSQRVVTIWKGVPGLACSGCGIRRGGRGRGSSCRFYHASPVPLSLSCLSEEEGRPVWTHRRTPYRGDSQARPMRGARDDASEPDGMCSVG